MMKSVFWIVIFPLFDGLVLRHFLYKYVKKYLSYFPSVSIICIALIIGAVVALNRDLLLTFPVLIIVAVILHNTLGMGTGYSVARLFKASKENARTLAFEVGMQNSGLAFPWQHNFLPQLRRFPVQFSALYTISAVLLFQAGGGRKVR